MATMDYAQSSPFDVNEGDYLRKAINGNAELVGEATVNRLDLSAPTISTVSGSLRLTYFTAKKTESISQVSVVTGTTAAGATPTLIRFGVYSVDPATGDLTLVGSTPNDTALLVSTSSNYIKALSAPFTKVEGTRYAFGILVITAAATPTFYGTATLTGTLTLMPPKLCATLAAQADLPSTITDSSLTSAFNSVYSALLP